MIRRHWPAVALLAAALFGLTAGAPAQSPPQESASALAAQERIDSLRAELERLAGERADVVREFETSDVELAIRREQLTILLQRDEMLRREETREAAQVAILEQLLAESRDDLGLRVESLYRIGPLSYNRLLLAADNAQDVLVAYQLVTYLGDRDRRLVRAVRGTLDDVSEARDTLSRTVAQLQRLQQEAAEVTRQLEQQQEARRETLTRLDIEAEAGRLALQKAERDAADLASTLAALESVTSDARRSFVKARGALPWPVPGDVTTGFGRQKHPVYDTYTLSRGIEIAAAQGEPVTVVFPGRVVFADWYSGYGLLVIIDHGDDHFTLYGHLLDVAVRVGDAVLAGERIGSVGETGSLTGPNLYFEVRQGTDALDPLRWLTRR